MDPTKKIIPFAAFVVLASPQAFETVRAILGGWVATAEGVPTIGGLILHALVFVILTHVMTTVVYGSKKASGGGCGCGA